jgi:hypothetical protein
MTNLLKSRHRRVPILLLYPGNDHGLLYVGPLGVGHRTGEREFAQTFACAGRQPREHGTIPASSTRHERSEALVLPGQEPLDHREHADTGQRSATRPRADPGVDRRVRLGVIQVHGPGVNDRADGRPNGRTNGRTGGR